VSGQNVKSFVHFINKAMKFNSSDYSVEEPRKYRLLTSALK